MKTRMLGIQWPKGLFGGAWDEKSAVSWIEKGAAGLARRPASGATLAAPMYASFLRARDRRGPGRMLSWNSPNLSACQNRFQAMNLGWQFLSGLSFGIAAGVILTVITQRVM